MWEDSMQGYCAAGNPPRRVHRLRSSKVEQIKKRCPTAGQTIRRVLQLSPVLASHLQEVPCVEKRFQDGARHRQPIGVVGEAEFFTSSLLDDFQEPLVQAEVWGEGLQFLGPST